VSLVVANEPTFKTSSETVSTSSALPHETMVSIFGIHSNRISNVSAISTLLLLLTWEPILSSAFVSRASSRPRTLVPSNAMSKLSQAEESKTVDLLQGKLRVLEEVVDEMYRRDNENKESADAIKCEHDARLDLLGNQLNNAKAKEEKLTEEIQHNKASAASRDKQSSREIENLEAESSKKDEELKNYSSEIAGLRYEIQKKSKDTSAFHSELQGKSEEIELLNDRISAGKKDAEEQARNLNNELAEAKKTELDQMENQIKTRVQNYEETIRSLEHELASRLEVENDYQERIEISMAAVSAAEQREKAAVLKSEEANKKLKQAQFQALAQRLQVKCLEDGQLRLKADAESFKQELQYAEAKVTEVKPRYSPRKSVRRLWSRFSKR
jgi:DNA repair exonuclease SbcCD ATPase subunit